MQPYLFSHLQPTPYQFLFVRRVLAEPTAKSAAILAAVVTTSAFIVPKKIYGAIGNLWYIVPVLLPSPP